MSPSALECTFHSDFYYLQFGYSFPSYAFNFWNCTCVYLYKIDHEVLSNSQKYFTFVIHIYSFTCMISSVFFIWQWYFVCFFVFLQMCIKLLLQFINMLHLAAILVLWHQWQIMYLMFSRHIFYLFMPLTFEIIHTCVSMKNTNDHEVLHDSHKYFTYARHICSFTSMTP